MDSVEKTKIIFLISALVSFLIYFNTEYPIKYLSYAVYLFGIIYILQKGTKYFHELNDKNFQIEIILFRMFLIIFIFSGLIYAILKRTLNNDIFYGSLGFGVIAYLLAYLTIVPYYNNSNETKKRQIQSIINSLSFAILFSEILFLVWIFIFN